jgi:hypothetical protein
MKYLLDVGSLFIGADAADFRDEAMLQALSAGFPGGIRFFQLLHPAPPTARLTVMPA